MLEQEPQQLVRFRLCQLVDPLGEALIDKKTLPPGDGVCPDHGVDRGEFGIVVLGRTTVGPDVLVVPFGNVEEEWRLVGSGESLEEALVGGGKTVVGLVGRSPERVTADGGQGANLQRGVVGGDVLEGDVGVLERSQCTVLLKVGGVAEWS
jgi:hypothetical protein